MKHPGIILMMALLLGQSSLAQDTAAARHFLSIQPTVSLDNFMPRGFTGPALQYEYALSPRSSLALHGLWIPFWGNPVFESLPRIEGFAVAGELRYYFSAAGAGWHAGPFAEVTFYERRGYPLRPYTTSSKQSFEVGAYVGHKWVRGSLTFDISVRTAWFSQEEEAASGWFFPASSPFNSHLLISLGYAFK